MQSKWQTILLWLLAGIVLGASFVQLMVSSGSPFPVSPDSLIITLPVTAIASYLATLPVLNYRRKLERFQKGEIKNRPRRVNPFYAFRVLILSRALAIAGSGFIGWHLGELIWLAAFSVPTSGLLLPTVLALIGGILMLLAGVFGESNCKAPKDSDPGAA